MKMKRSFLGIENEFVYDVHPAITLAIAFTWLALAIIVEQLTVSSHSEAASFELENTAS